MTRVEEVLATQTVDIMRVAVRSIDWLGVWGRIGINLFFGSNRSLGDTDPPDPLCAAAIRCCSSNEVAQLK